MFVYQRVKTTDWSVAKLISFPTTLVKSFSASDSPFFWSNIEDPKPHFLEKPMLGPSVFDRRPFGHCGWFFTWGRLASRHMDALEDRKHEKRTHCGLKELFIPGFLDASHVFFMFFFNMFSPVHWKNINVLNNSVAHFPFLQVKRWKHPAPCFLTKSAAFRKVWADLKGSS